MGARADQLLGAPAGASDQRQPSQQQQQKLGSFEEQRRPMRGEEDAAVLVDVAAGEEAERAAAGNAGCGGAGGNRWPPEETLALLKIRSEMDAAFRDASLKGPLWEDVSSPPADGAEGSRRFPSFVAGAAVAEAAVAELQSQSRDPASAEALLRDSPRTKPEAADASPSPSASSYGGPAICLLLLWQQQQSPPSSPAMTIVVVSSAGAFFSDNDRHLLRKWRTASSTFYAGRASPTPSSTPATTAFLSGNDVRPVLGNFKILRFLEHVRDGFKKAIRVWTRRGRPPLYLPP